MATIGLQCNSLSQIHLSVFQAENNITALTARVNMGEVLIEVSSRVICQTSECTKREFEKILTGFTQAPTSLRKR